MSFHGRTMQWPGNPADWAIWAIVLVAVFIAWSRTAGRPAGSLATVAAFIGYGIDRHFYIPAAILCTGIAALFAGRPRHARLPARVAAREGFIILCGFALYEVGRLVTEGDSRAAQANAERIIAFERKFGLYVEPAIQDWHLKYDPLITLSARFYSFVFIPVVLCGLLWLLPMRPRAYRVLRNSLGAAALFGVLTFWLYPVAPPRLVAASAMIDVHDLTGRSHGFVNEFAAVPSFHVGWTMLVGYVFWWSYRPSPWRWLAWTPGFAMLLVVIATGNHYWFDGLAGALYCLIPARIGMSWPGFRRWWRRWISGGARPRRSAWQSSRGSLAASANCAALGSLLLYLLVRQAADPGFTDYWGYMVAQIAVTIAAVLWLTGLFAAEGGLSPLTHAIIVAVTYADTLGTAAGFYARFVTYDKITHFGGGAILAATAYDVLRALRQRGALSWSLPRRMLIAGTVAVTLGGVWEVYEVLGDLIFDTGRHAGSLDTLYDLVSDTTGAALTVALLARRERRLVLKHAPAAWSPVSDQARLSS